MWGHMAEELSDEVWDELNHPNTNADRDLGLGLLLKMARCHDLALQEMLFHGQDMNPVDDKEVDEDDLRRH